MPKTSERLGLTSLMPIEERRKRRRQLMATEISKVLSGNDAWRFHYCVAHIIDQGEVWAPWIGNDLSFLGSTAGELMCVWPHEDLGVRASRHYKTRVSIDPIPLDIWIDTFLDVELRRDNLKVVLCPSAKSGEPRSVDEVLPEIAKCLRNREDYWLEHFATDEFVIVGGRTGPTGKLPG
jgi:Protein of unknown function (DUF2750)